LEFLNKLYSLVISKCSEKLFALLYIEGVLI